MISPIHHAKPRLGAQKPNRASAVSNSELAEARSFATPIRTVVLEESPTMLKTLSSILQERDDIQLIGAATCGLHALRRVAELAPDLVLVGSRLPGMNGFDAARQIKAGAKPPAVIVVTPDDSPEYRTAACTCGSDGAVAKHSIFSQLHAAIRRLFPSSAS